MFKLSFYVTDDYLEPVKKAIFAAGAGEYGDFKHCCWQTRGEGQYQMKGEELKKQIEWKVEIYCMPSTIKPVLEALRASHPCDEPAFDVVDMLEF